MRQLASHPSMILCLAGSASLAGAVTAGGSAGFALALAGFAVAAGIGLWLAATHLAAKRPDRLTARDATSHAALIAERDTASREAEDGREILSAVLDGITDAVAIFSECGTLRHWNRPLGTALALSAGRPEAGMTMENLLSGLALRTNAPDSAMAGHWKNNLRTVTFDADTADGRAYRLCRSPMLDGGFVLTLSERQPKAALKRPATANAPADHAISVDRPLMHTVTATRH